MLCQTPITRLADRYTIICKTYVAMKVLFDYQCFQMQRFGGVSNSYVQLIMQLSKMGVDVQMGLRDTKNMHLLRTGLVSSQSSVRRLVNGILARGGNAFDGLRQVLNVDQKSYNRDYSIQKLQEQQFDIFEPTFFNPYFIPYLKRKPFVTTVHDMTMERMPEIKIDEVQKAQKKVISSVATMLHCPSENTKQDIVEIYGIDPERVVVIYHGAPEKVDFDKARIIENPYLLYVGDRRTYKNFVPFIRECAKVYEIFPELHLLCTGSPFTNDEQNLLSELHITERVHQIRVSDAGMANLYYNAVAFVYPSLYEGFGLPILEAYTYGCPVLLTPYSCFPEIAGDAAMYFEMKDGKSDFYDVVRSLYTMTTDDREQLVTKGTERLKRYSWKQSARQLLKMYERII